MNATTITHLPDDVSPTSLLSHYEAKAKTMSDLALLYAIHDVSETLTIWQHEETPYTAKLLAEFDAYTVERQRRKARA